MEFYLLLIALFFIYIGVSYVSARLFKRKYSLTRHIINALIGILIFVGSYNLFS